MVMRETGSLWGQRSCRRKRRGLCPRQQECFRNVRWWSSRVSALGCSKLAGDALVFYGRVQAPKGSLIPWVAKPFESITGLVQPVMVEDNGEWKPGGGRKIPQSSKRKRFGHRKKECLRSSRSGLTNLWHACQSGTLQYFLVARNSLLFLFSPNNALLWILYIWSRDWLSSLPNDDATE